MSADGELSTNEQPVYAGDQTAPGAWDCTCGPAHNSAIVKECPVCHTARPFDYEAPEPTPLTLDERFDAAIAEQRRGLQVAQAGKGPGYHVPVRFKSGPTVLEVDSLLIQSITDVSNRAANLGAVVEMTAQLASPTQARLTLQVEYDFTGQPLPRVIEDK